MNLFTFILTPFHHCQVENSTRGMCGLCWGTRRHARESSFLSANQRPEQSLPDQWGDRKHTRQNIETNTEENDRVMSVTCSVIMLVSDWSVDINPGLVLAETDHWPAPDVWQLGSWSMGWSRMRETWGSGGGGGQMEITGEVTPRFITSSSSHPASVSREAGASGGTSLTLDQHSALIV